ncbi:zinc finger CCCH domain-containing protein 14-like isoform X3 [Anguilla anguilla]|uniref:zinc finger CCCH domain-containing protein 14-like isoform X3 n=1 Tax=Anguilla anguilla TaxID=7936 RepID=UPI0015B1175A|nr:zinc finger CCCH domain-containing protein 14-like isoform X3 [Anguilla anguilla]
MEYDTDLTKYIRAAIKRKLQELGPCVEEELTDYIMVLVANKKNSHQMAEDLSLFLGRNSVKFTLWLHGVLEKLDSMAIDPGLLRPHYLQAMSSVSIGQADGGGEELQASTLSSMHSHSMDAPLSISNTFTHYRNCFTEKSVLHVSRTVQPPIGRLYSDAGFRVEPELGKAPEAAFTSRPGLKMGVTVPCGLGWPSQGTGHQLSPSQVPDGTHGHRSSEPPRGIDQPQYVYRRPEDSCPAGDPVTRASKDRDNREEVMSWRWEHQMVSSIEHPRSDTGQSRSSAFHRLLGRWDERESQSSVSPKFIVTLDGAPTPLKKLEDDGKEDESQSRSSAFHPLLGRPKEEAKEELVSEVGGPSDAHCFMQRKPLVGGSIRRKLATTVGEEALVSTPHVAQGSRWDESQSGVSPKFIVTLDGAPTPLKKLEDDGREDEKENGSMGAKRRKVPERCRFWPVCESGDKCLYHHPITHCKTFPHCSFGDKCLFIHPDCKYNAQCTRADCPYTHSSKRSLTPLSRPEAKLPPDLCHFFPECEKMDCQFYHPKPCRFRTRCKRADCYFYHPPVPSGHAQAGQIPKQSCSGCTIGRSKCAFL